MPQFVIEREMPGVGKLSGADLKGASQTSCSVLRDLGPESSGSTAMSPTTRFTASTARRART